MTKCFRARVVKTSKYFSDDNFDPAHLLVVDIKLTDFRKRFTCCILALWFV